MEWLNSKVRWTYSEKRHYQMSPEAVSFCCVTGFDKLPRNWTLLQLNHMRFLAYRLRHRVWFTIKCLQPVIAEAVELHVASCSFSCLTSLLNPKASISVRKRTGCIRATVSPPVLASDIPQILKWRILTYLAVAENCLLKLPVKQCQPFLHTWQGMFVMLTQYVAICLYHAFAMGIFTYTTTINSSDNKPITYCKCCLAYSTYYTVIHLTCM